jgi:hypothetical protein
LFVSGLLHVIISQSYSFESNKAFKEAVENLGADLETSERQQFLDAYKCISLDQTLQTIKDLEENDGTNRRNKKALGPAIRIIEQFMAGVSIAIQQNPEISSLVVGAVRFVVDVSIRIQCLRSLAPNLLVTLTV